MDLKELLGADFKEGITAEEVNSIMEKRLLSTGRYENKEKVDAERTASKKKYADLEAQLKGKMTDDELTKNEKAELEKQLEEVKSLLKAEKKSGSRSKAEAGIMEAKTLLGIKSEDKDFNDFLDSISFEDSAISTKTSSYVMKMVKDAYEKGKAEATKDSLGEMGNMVIGKDGKMVDKDVQFIKQLTETVSPQANQNTQSNFI